MGTGVYVSVLHKTALIRVCTQSVIGSGLVRCLIQHWHEGKSDSFIVDMQSNGLSADVACVL